MHLPTNHSADRPSIRSEDERILKLGCGSFPCLFYIVMQSHAQTKTQVTPYLKETCAPKWSYHFKQKSYIKEGNAEKWKLASSQTKSLDSSCDSWVVFDSWVMNLGQFCQLRRKASIFPSQSTDVSLLCSNGKSSKALTSRICKESGWPAI